MLDEAGNMPDIQTPEPEDLSEEEAEDPPGEWVLPSAMSVGQTLDVIVMEKRKYLS